MMLYIKPCVCIYVGVCGCAFTSSVQVCIKEHTFSNTHCSYSDCFNNPALSVHCVCVCSSTKSVSLSFIGSVFTGVDVCVFLHCVTRSLPVQLILLRSEGHMIVPTANSKGLQFKQ